MTSRRIFLFNKTCQSFSEKRTESCAQASWTYTERKYN